MRSSMRLLSLGATAAFIITACTGGGASTAPSAAPSAAASEAPSESASTAPSAAAVDWTACVAFDTGGLGDKGFNDLAKKGLEDAAAMGYTTFFSEAQGATDYAANITRLIDQGCQSIITVGFNQAQATIEATKANPDIAFAQVDAVWDETANGPTPANFSGLDFQIDEAAMLAGYLAAGFSKSGKIGTYGGQQFPGVTRFMDGLYAGIKYHNEKKGTNVELLGWNAATQTGTFVGGDNPWGDPAKGEQLAQTFLDQGVDIVHPVSGATGNGTLKAMLAAGKWGIGVDTDQAISLAEYAGAIITSAEKVIDVAVVETFTKNSGGDTGGENFIGTLENKGVRISPFHEFEDDISAELKAEIAELETAIAGGSVKVADYLK
ncbi:MAG TPA: BMP family ABC transporter substrate-binding protein [Candidatus Limnocylindrales bacterium]|nr:BMP family ABC transporter substrate-binding protein [Candidatus Limnocylindrales bacterium]